jgi:hypothetical protein
MAITSGLGHAFKQDALSMAIQSGDTIKMAFYSSSATIGPDTAVYTATNEVTNSPNIPAGGVTLSGRAVGDGTPATAYVDWDNVSVTVTGTFTARGCMLYNATRSNRNIGTIDFGADKTATDGPFTVTIPQSGTGAVRFGPNT